MKEEGLEWLVLVLVVMMMMMIAAAWYFCLLLQGWGKGIVEYKCKSQNIGGHKCQVKSEVMYYGRSKVQQVRR